MRSKIDKEIKVTLVLNDEEARWLHRVMENGTLIDPELETEYDINMRQSFSDATFVG